MATNDWTTDGARITDAAVMRALQGILEDASALIVEHRHYRGAAGPTRFICEDFAELEQYLKSNVRPGDAFWVWRFDECCRDDNPIQVGKVPNERGEVPRGGAY